MKVLRTAILIMLCLGLALPSAHALALCIDSDGGLALEVAIGGACSGSNGRGSDGERTAADGLGSCVDAVDRCGSCTDVVLGGGDAAIPPPSFSAKHKLSRSIGGAIDTSYAPGNSMQHASRGARCSSSAPIPERPPMGDSVVLRL